MYVRQQGTPYRQRVRLPENYSGNAFREEQIEEKQDPPLNAESAHADIEARSAETAALLPKKQEEALSADSILGKLSSGSEELLLLALILLLSDSKSNDDLILFLLLLLFIK